MANINDNAAQSASQTKQILEYLRAGNRITPLEALRLFGTMRLNARIWDIECLTGIRPKRKRVRVQTANGGTAIVMQYWL
jgi:membrane protein implicated in regulation of membrane protease activity